MVELGLEHTFQDLSIGHEVFFHLRPGFERKGLKAGVSMWSLAAHARPTDPAPDTASGSAPSTPTRSQKALYVCSQGRRMTIYGTQEEASSAARRGLAHGSFRRIDVTQRVSDAFNTATVSALEVYNISDFSDSE
ncbi:hypothetical protein B0H14DRAFT_3478265 [Mycena olivaceomarginata]|nr:hypothetical protein B0H14DRAFT_3478265 [Mycena olivaceomarginata]